MKATQQALMQLMNKLDYQATIHKDTDQIYTSYNHQESDYHLFIRPLNDGNLVQIITFIPCTTIDTALNDLSRFLHIVNKELDMPGFCSDEETKTVFYRITIPCIQQEVSEELFEAYINMSKNICQTFGTVIQALSLGVMSLDEVFEKMTENNPIKDRELKT